MPILDRTLSRPRRLPSTSGAGVLARNSAGLVVLRCPWLVFCGLLHDSRGPPRQESEPALLGCCLPLRPRANGEADPEPAATRISLCLDWAIPPNLPAQTASQRDDTMTTPRFRILFSLLPWAIGLFAAPAIAAEAEPARAPVGGFRLAIPPRQRVGHRTEPGQGGFGLRPGQRRLQRRELADGRSAARLGGRAAVRPQGRRRPRLQSPSATDFPQNSVGWYRRTFDAAQDGCRAGGSGSSSTACSATAWCFVNGWFVGRHESGYSSFRYDITDVANCGGKNVVAVRVDASQFEGWFYEGRGHLPPRLAGQDRARWPSRRTACSCTAAFKNNVPTARPRCICERGSTTRARRPPTPRCLDHPDPDGKSRRQGARSPPSVAAGGDARSRRRRRACRARSCGRPNRRSCTGW